MAASEADNAYDYVVIGGGTAGCVLANRLSENKNASILLLEAGPEDTRPEIHELAGIRSNHMSEIDWQYKTAPQKHGCFAFRDHRVVWPRGKVLGGSSSINGMVFLRGCKEDFDSWARHGAKGWSYDEVLPYFLKSENNTNAAYAECDYHSTGGYLTLSDLSSTSKTSKLLIEGANELGFKKIDINNCVEPVGFNFTQLTMKDGKRCSTAVAFLNPAKKRENLTIWTETLATKILFSGMRAKSVEILKRGKSGTVDVRKEVILSTGMIASPQLLMLSGVGPRDHLQELGIPLVCDLPVGENLQDHVTTMIKYKGNAGGIGKDWVTNGGELNGLMKTVDKLPWPDIHVFFTPFYYFMGGGEKIKLNFSEEFSENLEHVDDSAMDAAQGTVFILGLLHPKSVGDLKLGSKNPLDHPIIDPHYLEDPEDVQTMIRGVRLVQKLMNTNAMKGHGITQTFFKFGDCPHEVDSDEYWEHVLRHLSFSLWHAVGTCKMGASDDPSAVVDPSLRVRGLDNVRVADASVMPHLISGYPLAPTIMIAEKAADLIKKDM